MKQSKGNHFPVNSIVLNCGVEVTVCRIFAPYRQDLNLACIQSHSSPKPVLWLSDYYVEKDVKKARKHGADLPHALHASTQTVLTAHHRCTLTLASLAWYLTFMVLKRLQYNNKNNHYTESNVVETIII